MLFSVTDIFIRRPVLAISLSAMILLAGIWAIFNIPLSLYPQVTVPLVQVSTVYPGANPDVVQNYVTNPLQSNLENIDGLDYITSSSTQGMSTITLHFQLGENLDQAISTVMRKVEAMISELPTGTMPPNINTGENNSYYFILRATAPKSTSLEWATDYLSRTTVPQLELLNGVSEAHLWGPQYSMNIELNPEHLIAHQITVDQIVSALQRENLPSAPGNTYGTTVNYLLNPETTLHTPADFDQLIIKNSGKNAIYLKEVGQAHFQSLDETVRAYFNGQEGDGIAIAVNPNSNPLNVASSLYQLMPTLQAHLPRGMQLGTVFNLAKYISASLHEVIKAIVESLLVVVAVMLLLMGSPRTLLVPLSAIPLSLVGVCFIMWGCHFSFNSLTLLAMVLAIGLVVDDAIVVVENIVRHMEHGENSLEASLIGAREICGPVIAMTLTLAAVYAPMFFASGITGHLFSEFAMTLAGSVFISGVIALTLSPFLCSRLINPQALRHRFVKKAENRVNFLRQKYLALLEKSFQARRKIIVAWLVMLGGCVYLYSAVPHELVPAEDTGILQVFAKGPADVNLHYLEKYRPGIEKILNADQNVTEFVEILQNNMMYGYVSLKDWSLRKLSSNKILANLQNTFNNIAGVQTYVSNISLLPGADGGNSVNLVLVGNVDYPTLYQAAKKLESLAMASKHFLYLQDDLDFNQPQMNLSINRDAAMAMNVPAANIANALTSFLSQGRVQQFSWQGHSYDVLISLPKKYRQNPEDILNLAIPNANGKLISLNSVLSMHTTVVPQSLSQFQKMNSVSLTALPAPGTSFSAALAILQHLANTQLDKNIFLDYSGLTRQFLQEGSRSLQVFALAFIIIFFVLSIQFNRFRDALIILLGSVPLAIFAALFFLWMGLGTINIFTQIGLLTLVGLVSKHGILLTEFANHSIKQDRKSPQDAIYTAAALRFRPIIMTTAAMVVGALPLVFASGAGSESRHAIGIVIVCGMSVGTLFTLFILPTLYLLFSPAKQDVTLNAHINIEKILGQNLKV